eukprot:scaffold137986_cov115-Phaeocystis_antarctica.AAC.1
MPPCRGFAAAWAAASRARPRRSRPRSKTMWHRLRRAGSPEAAFSARACPRLPQASASSDQSAAWSVLVVHRYCSHVFRHRK